MKEVDLTLQEAGAAAELGTPATMQSRSFFDDDKSAYAGKVEIDGQWFYFDPLSAEAIAYYRGAAQRVAALLGMTVQQLNKTKRLMPHHEEIRDREEVALQEYLLSQALRSWTLPVNCTEDRKKHLQPDVKREVAEAIVSFSVYGVGEARFRRLRDPSAGTGAESE